MKYRLSHAHIQMARELGLNPKKLGSLANHEQERWKLPLPQFIEGLYLERFGCAQPQVAMTIEEIAAGKRRKRKTRDRPPESAGPQSAGDPGGDPF